MQNKLIKEKLIALLKRPENHYCADCHCRLQGSIWASVSFGEFLCMRCATCHRCLGTHISFIRSVTLDNWTPEQVKKMNEVGNKKASQYWEYSLPKDFNRPTEDKKVQAFVYAKYLDKKWARKDTETIAINTEETKQKPIEEILIDFNTHTSAPLPVFDPFSFQNKGEKQLIVFDNDQQMSNTHSTDPYPTFDPFNEIFPVKPKPVTSQNRTVPFRGALSHTPPKPNKNDPFADLIKF